MLNDGLTDLSESLEGSERNSDENVLGGGAVSGLVLNLLSGSEVELTGSELVLGLSLLVLSKGLGALFLEVGVLLTLITSNQR